MTGASFSDGLVSYPEHSLQRSSWCILQLQPRVKFSLSTGKNNDTSNSVDLDKKVPNCSIQSEELKFAAEYIYLKGCQDFHYLKVKGCWGFISLSWKVAEISETDGNSTSGWTDYEGTRFKVLSTSVPHFLVVFELTWSTELFCIFWLFIGWLLVVLWHINPFWVI